mmetsp:Transcript_18585/g.52242  ORF Transcript_18585/g.52242 Transcript_18585/m.52242 type:complete len:235 (-) Transcript_18585:657-1361(-)
MERMMQQKERMRMGWRCWTVRMERRGPSPVNGKSWLLIRRAKSSRAKRARDSSCPWMKTARVWPRVGLPWQHSGFRKSYLMTPTWQVKRTALRIVMRRGKGASNKQASGMHRQRAGEGPKKGRTMSKMMRRSKQARSQLLEIVKVASARARTRMALRWYPSKSGQRAMTRTAQAPTAMMSLMRWTTRARLRCWPWRSACCTARTKRASWTQPTTDTPSMTRACPDGSQKMRPGT